jgi:glycosyltransferase involved in cell wall biosynthesis
MKVALFVHCFFPDHFYGTETYTLQVAQTLIELGYDITVVAGIFQGETKQADFETHYVFDGVPVIALDKNHEPHSRIAETYWQEAMRPRLAKVLHELRPDIIHVTHLINHTAVLLEVAKSAGIPVVATLTDFFGFCYNNKLEAADGSLCGGPNLLRSNCVACHLRAVNDGAQTNRRPRLGYGMAGLRMRVSYALGLPGPADARTIVPDVTERPAVLRRAYETYAAMIAPTKFLEAAYVRNGFGRSRLRLSRFGVNLDRSIKPQAIPGSPLVIGYVGQIAAHKGVDLLLAAAATIPPGRLELRIYGPSNQDPAYMARLRAMAPPGTQFLGTFPSSEMAAVLRPMDLLAIPSTWYENSPLVLLNALATHTPVLVSDVQGLTEFITEGVDGWSFKRGNGADLARVLAKLCAAPDVVRAASANTHYHRTTKSMGDDVAAVYAQVISSRAAAIVA